MATLITDESVHIRFAKTMDAIVED